MATQTEGLEYYVSGDILCKLRLTLLVVEEEANEEFGTNGEEGWFRKNK